MKIYILKRLVMMIPTLFGISLIVFIVLNLAPGHTGGSLQASTFAAMVRSQTSDESERLFREQFHLDKPILFNTRFTLNHDTIRQKLAIVSGVHSTDASARIRARQALIDYGAYAVPGLLEILKPLPHSSASTETLIRDSAVYFLSFNSRRRNDPVHPDPTIEAENQTLRKWRYDLEAPEFEKKQIIAQWIEWYDRHPDRWTLTTPDKIRLFFLDTRFAHYWANLLRLDFGVSRDNEPVLVTLIGKLKYSLSLSLVSLLLAYLISIPLGIFSAVFKDTRADRVVTVLLFVLYSLPVFFVGMLLLTFVTDASPFPALRWFPVGGWQEVNDQRLTSLEQIGEIIKRLVLPVLCLTYGSLAVLSRYMRAGLLEVIQSDYIRAARARGLDEWTVVLKHGVRNGLLPILTLLANLLPAAMGGAVIVEYLFGIPGMGAWVVEAVRGRDLNVVMAVQMISTVLTLLGILLSDIAYAMVDPRITYE